MGRNSCQTGQRVALAHVVVLAAITLLPGCCLFGKVKWFPPPDLLVDRKLVFAPVDIGESARERLRVLNRSDSSVRVLRVVIESASDADQVSPFVVDFPGQFTVLPAQERWIEFTYTPDASSRIGATAVLTTTNGVYEVRLEATRPEAHLDVSPGDHVFDRVRNGTCEQVELVLQNLGEVAIEITRLSFPESVTEFVVDPEAPAALPWRLGTSGNASFSDTLSVAVRYCPGSRDVTSTDLTIGWTHSIDEEEETLVSFTVDQTPPCLAVTPADDLIDLGEVPVGTVVEQLFRIENCAVGERARGLWVNQVSLEPTHEEGSGDTFLLSGDPEEPVLLQPADSLEVLVTFAPAQAGQTDSATLSIISTDPAQVVRHIQLTGTGVAIP